MMSCTRSLLDSPTEASRPSFHGCDDPSIARLASRRLVRRPSKLQTTMEVTRCRFGSTSRQAAPIGCEEFVPQKDWTPISHAVYHDREAALQHYLQTGVSPDAVEGPGVPLLCIAVACGHFEIVEILLKAGANVNSASRDKGETALHIAVRMSRHDVIELLLVHRADLELKTSDTGQTPLHYAAAAPNSIALVTKLLKLGAKYDVNDLQGHTAAVIALQAHNVHAAVAIINMARGKPKQLAKEKDMLMQHIEIAHDRTSATNDLIADVFAATCDPDSTVLIEAIKRNDPRLVEMFLEREADPRRATTKGLMPIFVAVKFANLRIIKLLVQHGAEVTTKGPGQLSVLQILFTTLGSRDEDSIVHVVGYLFAKGADATTLYPDGKTLLHRAVSAGIDHAKVAKLLIKNGIDVDAQDADGNTALHLAASNGLVNTTQCLLDSRANATVVDSKKCTALLRAIQNHQWIVVPLLAVPPAVTSWDAEGSTALHHISRSTPQDHDSWSDIAAATIPFCERGICRSMRDRSGATPLIQAIRLLPEDGLPVVESLLTKGDGKWNCVGHEDHKRHDALYYAATLGKTIFVKALLENGAPFVLEDWSSARGQLRLPAASNDEILELIVESDRSRKAQAIANQHDTIPETRIEIVRSELRTNSALSGYHADCEMERKAKANRRTFKKSPPMQHLQFEVQQRKPAARSNEYPVRTTSIQQRSREPIIHYRKPVHQTYTTISSAFSPSQNVPAKTRTVHFVQHGDQQVTGRTSLGNIPHESTAAFPPRSSSRHQMTTRPKVGTTRSHAAVGTDETTIVDKQPHKVVASPNENPRAIQNQDAPVKETLSPPISSEKSAETAPKPAPVSATDLPKPTTPQQIAAPLPEKPTAPTTTSPKPVPSTSPPSTATAPPVPPKPTQPARIDSGVSLVRESSPVDAVPVLDRTQRTLDSAAPSTKRQSADELASWLAISKMMDRL